VSEHIENLRELLHRLHATRGSGSGLIKVEAREGSGTGAFKGQLDPMWLANALFHQFRQSSIRNNCSMIHHHDAITTRLDFFQLMSGQ
jgi:hypothetical protein